MEPKVFVCLQKTVLRPSRNTYKFRPHFFFVFFSGASARFWVLASPHHSFEAQLGERISPKPKHECEMHLVQNLSGPVGLNNSYAAPDLALDWCTQVFSLP